MKNVTVYCASSPKVDDAYLDAAAELGKELALSGKTIIYGGGAIGLMGELADAALSHRGKVIGIIPSFMRKLEWGHEAITEGFRVVYGEGPIRLFTLFSAGGATNADMPEDASYRRVTPMALTVKYRDGTYHIEPWPIDYEPFNRASRNRFYER